LQHLRQDLAEDGDVAFEQVQAGFARALGSAAVITTMFAPAQSE
jgi:hypothetical protein